VDHLRRRRRVGPLGSEGEPWAKWAELPMVRNEGGT
jgi:hypothetical protein